MSPGRRQVVLAVRSWAGVENAFVESLPTNVWSCEKPGWRGSTIGSSGPRWLKLQTLMKLTPRSGGEAPREPPAVAARTATDATANAASRRVRTPVMRIKRSRPRPLFTFSTYAN